MRHNCYKAIKTCDLCGAPILSPVWWKAHSETIVTNKGDRMKKAQLGIPRYEIPEIPTCRHIIQKERLNELR